jgi:hypothetical protein
MKELTAIELSSARVGATWTPEDHRAIVEEFARLLVKRDEMPPVAAPLADDAEIVPETPNSTTHAHGLGSQRHTYTSAEMKAALQRDAYRFERRNRGRPTEPIDLLRGRDLEDRD